MPNPAEPIPGEPVVEAESGTARTTRGAVLAARCSAFWFKPAQAIDLGLCRFLFFAGVLSSRIPGDAEHWGKVPKRFYKPIGFFDLLNLPVFRSNTLQIIEICWWIVLAMAAVGSFTRTTVFLSFLAGLYTLGLPNNFGKVGHGDQLTILVMLILALSRCGDGFSIDRWFKKMRGAPLMQSSADYRWPIQMVWMLMAAIFCSAGITKLQRVGLTWITSENFEIMLIQAHYGLNRPPTQWGLQLAQYPWLCKLAAGGCVALEVLFPLALLHGRLRWTIVPLTLSMQIGIGLLMGIWFMPFLRAYLFWVPWESVRAGVQSFRARRRSAGVGSAQSSAQSSSQVGVSSSPG